MGRMSAGMCASLREAVHAESLRIVAGLRCSQVHTRPGGSDLRLGPARLPAVEGARRCTFWNSGAHARFLDWCVDAGSGVG